MSSARLAAMVLFLGCSIGSQTVVAAGRKPLPKKIDISKIRDKMLVLHDKKSHYFVVPNLLDNDVMRSRLRIMGRLALRDVVFYGDGKRMFLQRTPSKGRNPPKFTITFFDPRARQPSNSVLVFRPPENGGRTSPATSARRRSSSSTVRRARLLTKASFHRTFWRRTPHLLARDEDGVYFYVDRRKVYTSDGIVMKGVDLKDFRIWVGRRGRMKRLKLNDVIVDPAGQIFVTKRGRLRVEAKKKQYTWEVGAKRAKLTRVKLTAFNGGLMLLYRQLGPYLGERLGRPCDDL